MRSQNTIQRWILTLCLAVFLGAGYLAMNLATSHRADAYICFSGDSCSQNLISTFSTSFANVQGMAALQVGGELIAYLYLMRQAWMNSINNTTDAAEAKIRQGIDTFWWYNLRPSLQMMTEQLSLANAEQAVAIIKLNDVAEVNRAKLDMEEAEIESKAQTRPAENACVAATVSGGMTKAAAIRTAYGSQAPIMSRAGASSMNPEGSPILARSVNAVGTPAARGRAADAAARFQNMREKYYDPNANDGYGGCPGCPSGSLGANKDLDVAGNIFSKPTIKLTDRDTTEAVINDMIVNLAEPFVLDTIPATAVNSEKGHQQMLDRNSYHAKRQVVYDALYHVVSRRAPGSNMGSFINEIRSAAGFTPPADSNPSHNEIMEAMMNDRFRSGKYSISQIDEPETNSKEMVIQQAFQAMQLSDQLDLLDRYAMIVAARAGDSTSESKKINDGIRSQNIRK